MAHCGEGVTRGEAEKIHTAWSPYTTAPKSVPVAGRSSCCNISAQGVACILPIGGTFYKEKDFQFSGYPIKPCSAGNILHMSYASFTVSIVQPYSSPSVTVSKEFCKLTLCDPSGAPPPLHYPSNTCVNFNRTPNPQISLVLSSSCLDQEGVEARQLPGYLRPHSQTTHPGVQFPRPKL